MTKLVQCTVCGSRIARQLNSFEETALHRDRVLKRFCSECHSRTDWRVPPGEQEPEVSAPMPLSNGVLLVGRDLAALREIEAMLKDCGAEAEIVSCFDEGITRIARHDFDLIISEHKPPAFDATRIVAFIKQHRPECMTQICFVVADSASPEDLNVLTQSGAVRWSASRAETLRQRDQVEPSC